MASAQQGGFPPGKKRKRRILPTDPRSLVEAAAVARVVDATGAAATGGDRAKKNGRVQSTLTGFFAGGACGAPKGPKQGRIDRMFGPRGGGGGAAAGAGSKKRPGAVEEEGTSENKKPGTAEEDSSKKKKTDVEKKASEKKAVVEEGASEKKPSAEEEDGGTAADEDDYLRILEREEEETGKESTAGEEEDVTEDGETEAAEEEEDDDDEMNKGKKVGGADDRSGVEEEEEDDGAGGEMPGPAADSGGETGIAEEEADSDFKEGSEEESEEEFEFGDNSDGGDGGDVDDVPLAELSAHGSRRRRSGKKSDDAAVPPSSEEEDAAGSTGRRRRTHRKRNDGAAVEEGEGGEGRKKAAVGSFFKPKKAETNRRTERAGSRDRSAIAIESDEDDDDDDDDGDDAPRVSVRMPVSTAPKAAKKTASGPAKKSDLIVHPPDKELLSSAPWGKGGGIGGALPYAAVCDTFQEIEEISSRLEITSALTALFRRILLRHPNSFLPAVYLASNSVAPSYEGLELGIGDSILIKAVSNASGTTPAAVKQKLVKCGDLGTIAETAKSRQRTLFKSSKVLSAAEVLETLRWMGSKSSSGKDSTRIKAEKIQSLLVRASTGRECKYIVRALQGKLRIGLARTTVLVALAWSVALSPPPGAAGKEAGDPDSYPPDERTIMTSRKLPTETLLECAVRIVKKAYSEAPSFERILDAALTAPLTEMHRFCALSPGVPVEPMLAKPTKSVQEVLKRLSGLRFTCEYKYDGERAQVHMMDGGVTKVFSRNLLTTTEKYPEVPRYTCEACASTGVSSFILDTEVVAFNRVTGKLVPFQVLSTRKSKDVSEENIKVQVIVQAFDLMYLNGESLLGRTLAVRRELMKKHFLPVDGKFQYAKHLDHHENGDTTLLEEFLTEAVENQCEGLMVKTLDDNAIYEPTKRSLNWLKLKKDYQENLGDSIDLVPIGAYHGKGKRAGKYGAYLLACYDPDTEEYQSVCKIGTGFSDENLVALTEALNDGHTTEEKSPQYNVNASLECDVWLDAVQVWEVRAADLSKSPVHTGALDRVGEPGRGIGLRFPRFERVRPDKRPEQATTSDQILEMYYAQDSVVDPGGAGDDDEL